MFWIILLMLFVGISLMVLEAVLPYGISYVMGLGVIGFAVFLAYREDPQAGMLILVLAFPAAGGAAWWAFRSGSRFLGLKPPDADGAEPGKGTPPDGEVVTVCQTLRPTGTVVWQNLRFPARSTLIEIESPVGSQARVTGRDSVYLVVEPTEQGKPNESSRSSADDSF